MSEAFTVTAAAMRPASSERRCFYCRQAIGGTHKDDCVLIKRRVLVRMTVEYEVEKPADWDASNVEFHLNESTWCGDNVIQDLEAYVERLELEGRCLCDDASFEFVRPVGEAYLSENNHTELEHRALIFADKAHAAIDQRRKYSGEPYIVHPIGVANIVLSVDHTSEMIAAAFLHDVVEDTSISIGEIEAEFGVDVAKLVWWLTDASKPSDGNRATRKEIDRFHLSRASPAAKTIKLADIIDNAKSIRQHDPDFWKVYRREMQRLLEVLKEGDKQLWERVAAECEMGTGK